MPELEPGTIFAGHRIESVAGRGGMGVVYRATHLALDHVVALKVISPGLAADEVFRRRFERESRAAVSIRHPNVVAIHHAGEEDGLLFVTMDLIDGTDLRRLLRAQGAVDPRRAVALLGQVAGALDAAHQRGLVHRDVKPGNVLIESPGTDEHVYLTDFGLTKPMDAASGVTETGAFVGTLDYIAPEQIRGERLDARTDVYALGCVLFEMLAGQPPFATRAEKVAKIYGHLEDDPPSVAIYATGAPPGLGGAVQRALAKRPDDRFPSAGDLAAAARVAVEGGTAPTEEHSVATGLAAPTSEQAIPSIADESTVESPAARPAEEPVADQTAPGRRPPVEPPSEPAVGGGPAGERPQAPVAGPPAADPEPEAPVGEPPTGSAAPALHRRRRPRAAAVAGIGLAILAVAALALTVLDGGGGGGDGAAGGEPSAETSSQADEEPTGPRLVGDPIRVPGIAVDAVAGAGSVWISSRRGEVRRLDPEIGAEQDRIEVEGEPFQLAFDDDEVWAALGSANQVARIDAASGAVEHFAVGPDPRGVDAGAGAVWVANTRGDTVTRLDPSGGFVAEIAVGDYPRRVAVAGGFVWVSNLRSDSVTRIDPATNEAVEIGGLAEPKGIAAAGGRVWVTEVDAGRLVPIDPDQAAVSGRRIEVGDRPQGVLSAFGSLWVSNLGGTVARVDIDRRRVSARVDIAGEVPLDGDEEGPEGLAAADGRLWVTLAEGDAVVRIAP